MSQDQAVITAIVVLTMGMFVWGKFRHDIVAMGSLLLCVAAGLVPESAAFSGFSHPAVVTVACVLVLSHSLQSSGLVDMLAHRLLPAEENGGRTVLTLTGLAAGLSSIMNNVGALGLLMPMAIRAARHQKLAAGRLLMPLAFGSILGGMTTLIGTPPNLIVSGFRAQASGSGFSMFDFTPVGLSIAVPGLLFLALVGWRLVPNRKTDGDNGFKIGTYITEVRVPEKSKAIGMGMRQFETGMDKAGAQVIALVRGGLRLTAPSAHHRIQSGDTLIIEAEPDGLAMVLSSLDLKLEGTVVDEGEEKKPAAPAVKKKAKAVAEPSSEPAVESAPASDDIELTEFVVPPGSSMIGYSASDISLRSRFGINLLAVSRQGRSSASRIRAMKIRAGDVLLLQGLQEKIDGFVAFSDCIPLEERPLHLPDNRKAWSALAIMLAAVGCSATGLLSAPAAFAAGVFATLIARIIPLRIAYSIVDWPVIVLIAALIPVAGAIVSTGTANLAAGVLVDIFAQGNIVVGLTIILVVTMTLSDFLNNAATAAMMCPVAMSTADRLGASSDAFLMAVAVGASCAFLTPIGHQNNTLILGPGGFRFGDYWRLGLPIEIIVIVVGVPLLLLVWS